MSYGIHSDEVAEDYRKALEDLTMNSRYEISNLTVIAKENTEHALAISEALKSHIIRVGKLSHGLTFCMLDVCLVLRRSSLELPDDCSEFLTYTSPDRPHQEAASILRARFCGQECWHAVYALFRSQLVLDIHGGIRACGQ